MDDENKPQGDIKWLQTYHLDLDDAVVCDTEGCNNESTVWFRVRCCGTIYFSCDTCYDMGKKYLKKMKMARQIIVCLDCNARCEPMTWLSPPVPL